MASILLKYIALLFQALVRLCFTIRYRLIRGFVMFSALWSGCCPFDTFPVCFPLSMIHVYFQDMNNLHCMLGAIIHLTEVRFKEADKVNEPLEIVNDDQVELGTTIITKFFLKIHSIFSKQNKPCINCYH